jgi:HD-like signal output (HDOD) protein
MKNFEESWRFPNIVACALRNIEEKQGPRLGLLHLTRYVAPYAVSQQHNQHNLHRDVCLVF